MACRGQQPHRNCGHNDDDVENGSCTRMRNPLATWISAHLTGPLDSVYARIDDDLTDDLASAHNDVPPAGRPRERAEIRARVRSHTTGRLVHH